MPQKKTKSSPSAAAVIEFSSNNVRMIVAERGEDNGMRILDFMENPLPIGKDTFTHGKLSFDKIGAACAIVKNYTDAAACYGVALRDIRLIATSALREARNKNYILDQIRLKTGIEVNILDSQEEKLCVFKTALRHIDSSEENPALLVFIGSGNIGFSVVEKGSIIFYQSIRIGPLRVSELFEDLARRSNEYHIVAREYINTYLNPKTLNLPGKISRLYLTGGDISEIKSLCGTEEQNGVYNINKSNITKLYDEIKFASAESISRDLNVPSYRADMLIPALNIINNFLNITGLTLAEALPAYVNESILYRSLYPEQAKETDKNFYRNTLLCVKTIAERYDVSVVHATQVDRFAMKIFDKIRKLHGMGARERALLQCAAYLHDCGKFIGIREHAMNSFNIIRGLDIMGFNQQEMRILGMMCLLHSSVPPESYNNFIYMPDSEKTATSKLAAILRLADALDRGGSQKINDIDVNLEGDILNVLAHSSLNIDLEKWSFGEKSGFFTDVFGIKPIIKLKASV